MAIAKSAPFAINPDQYSVQTFSQVSGANAVQTCSTDGIRVYRLVMILVAYSAAPTQTGVTVTLNAALGAGYDTLLQTGTANAQYTFYLPAGEVYLKPGDAIDVLCPAAGGAITSAATIYVVAY